MRNISGIKPIGFPEGSQVQRVSWTYYDHTTLATATALDQSFFSAGINNRTKLLTNFEGQGQMPKTKEFVVTGLGLYVRDGDSRDVRAFTNGAFVEFKIGDKNYFEAPAWELPAGVGPQIERQGGAALAATPANDVFLANNGVPALGNHKQLDVPLHLRPGENFSYRVVVPSALTLVATINIFAVMRGLLFRPRE